MIIPIINPTDEYQLEVVTVEGQTRQFLVNKEVHKGAYKFGNAKRRSCFVSPQDTKFYVWTGQQGDRTMSNKLDFELFLKWLELVARKVYDQEPGEALITLLKTKILPLYDIEVMEQCAQEVINFERQLSQAFEILDNNAVISCLSLKYKQLLPVFKKYWVNGSTKMDLAEYTKFINDYYLTKYAPITKLHKLYSYMINILKRSEGEFDPCRLVLNDYDKPSINEFEKMDSHMFIGK